MPLSPALRTNHKLQPFVHYYNIVIYPLIINVYLPALKLVVEHTICFNTIKERSIVLLSIYFYLEILRNQFGKFVLGSNTVQ